ncbi:HEAT repeat domain-containing protein [Streptomyces litchfieldiae]|uniref:HEAT repeat domain-containing protein n=1 Tax=Streptomyces litchfieldiae TaxID=3075543 RepID=A0ABU2N117_9ACTN|nr:HEAT repeat domain-containing protein [Streptomyces sp. DSM 44938]MDT0347009.1 HEAT repeat domain-containing protein [Streptomyces sp. DSM 44938]
MEIQRLIRLIGLIGDEAGDTPFTAPERETARRALIDRGAEAVPPLLAVLWDDHGPLEWFEAAWLLRRIGAPALGPLTAALAAAPSHVALVRARWAFAGLDVPAAAFGPALRHPHPRVRETTAWALQRRGAKALCLVPALLPLLDDPDHGVRVSAGGALRTMSPGVVGPLRRARRTPGSSARLRRGALAALAAVGGPAALDERDIAAVRRLIAVRARDEVPEPIRVCAPWFALRTADQDAVLAAFGLSAPEPVTMRLGASAWQHDAHAARPGHGACSRVYVSPALDGWTLVFGSPFQDAHRADGGISGPVIRRRCAELSRRFGEAHWYGMRCAGEWAAWCFGERGAIVRHYDAADPERASGPPHPWEPPGPLPHEADFPQGSFDGIDASDAEAFLASYEEVRRETGIPGPYPATDVAARASVSPAALGPRTRVTGRAVLALTACGRAHGHPPGALRI